MKFKIVLLYLITILLCCGSSVKNLSYTKEPLRNFNKIYVTVKSSSNNDQVLLALEGLKFELSKIGFSVVEDKSVSDAIVEFQVGTIRFDPLVGWIADEAFINFIDTKNRNKIKVYYGSGRFITPTVKNILLNLEKAIKKDF